MILIASAVVPDEEVIFMGDDKPIVVKVAYSSL